MSESEAKLSFLVVGGDGLHLTGRNVSSGKPPTSLVFAAHQIGGCDDIIRRFEALNPYDPEAVPGSILEVADENYTDTGELRPVRCYAIRSKRYQLTTDSGELIKCSEHGLGHLLDPTPLDARSDRSWITEAWAVLRTDHEPHWLDHPALSPVTIATADTLHWFAQFNTGREYSDQIKPSNFLTIVHTNPLDPSRSRPIAPHQNNPDTWAAAPWVDRNTGAPIRIAIADPVGLRRPNTVHVLTYRHILTRYQHRPEAKAALGGRNQVGQLQRRPMRAAPGIAHIGKETLPDHHELDPDSDQCIGVQYNDCDDAIWVHRVLPHLRTLGAAEVSRVSGVPLRTVQRALRSSCRPRRRTLTLLHGLVAT